MLLIFIEGGQGVEVEGRAEGKREREREGGQEAVVGGAG